MTSCAFQSQKNLIVLLDNTSQNVGRLSDTITKILYNQPYEPPKMSIVAMLEKTIREKGVEAGIAEYRDLKTKQSATYDFARAGVESTRLIADANGKG